ncbi:ISL3 family transposase [Bradyrhizobium sp. B120]|uniref:ISL3 family transposase n=1 Tax=Bradyrhizobium sp. B120 TaxID=3410088 RepID=UPI003B980554
MKNGVSSRAEMRARIASFGRDPIALDNRQDPVIGCSNSGAAVLLAEGLWRPVPVSWSPNIVSRSLISPELSIVQISPQTDRLLLVARPKSAVWLCPCCGCQTDRVHSHYLRRLADLPWQGRVVEIQLYARRFRCANSQCRCQIFIERLPATVRPKARRTTHLGGSQQAIVFAVGGQPGSRLSRKLAMPVSGDTLLRMVHSAPLPDLIAPTVVGIDDWACHRGQRYGTIICDLERNCVLDLLPDRNADSVARWLKRWPGIKVVARDRAGLYADVARCGAPNPVQVHGGPLAPTQQFR